MNTPIVDFIKDLAIPVIVLFSLDEAVIKKEDKQKEVLPYLLKAISISLKNV